MRWFYILLFIGVIFILAIVTGRRFELSDMENRAQFVEHFNSMLSIRQLASVKDHDFMAYILEYLRSVMLVNFGLKSVRQEYLCELLPKYKYPFSEKLAIRLTITVLR